MEGYFLTAIVKIKSLCYKLYLLFCTNTTTAENAFICAN